MSLDYWKQNLNPQVVHLDKEIEVMEPSVSWSTLETNLKAVLFEIATQCTQLEPDSIQGHWQHTELKISDWKKQLLSSLNDYMHIVSLKQALKIFGMEHFQDNEH